MIGMKMILISWLGKRLGPPGWRVMGRCAVLIAAALLALPVWPYPRGAALLPSLSPFMALNSLIANRTLDAMALLALPVVLLVMVRRRWFCRWVCPAGTCQSLAERHSQNGAWWLRLPPLGQWAVLLTLGGAILGYPVFLWLDPLALFNASIGLVHPGRGTERWLAGMGLPLLLLLSLLAPKMWCMRLCPLGGLQDLLSLPKRLGRKLKKTNERIIMAPATARAFLWAGALCWAFGLGFGWIAVLPPGRAPRPSKKNCCVPPAPRRSRNLPDYASAAAIASASARPAFCGLPAPDMAWQGS